MRIRRSKSLAFVGRPTISIILTLRSCDMQTFSPFRHNRVRWHKETNYGHSAPFCHPEAASPMTCGDKLWSHTFSPSRGDCVRWRAETNYGHSAPFHPGSIVSDGTQRQIMVILRPFVIQRQSCPMTCEDKLWSSVSFGYL